MKKNKKFKIYFVVLILYVIVFFISREKFFEAINSFYLVLKDMIQVLPPVMILSGLISVWVPKEIITKNFGKSSGFKGKLISIFIGSVSAGPIYAAFPLTQTLLYKGASIENTIIILSSWAVMKVPMLIVESKFLGLPFAVSRYLLTLPGILIMAYFANRLLSRKEVLDSIDSLSGRVLEIEEILPGFNCSGCGYSDCSEYAKAIFYENEIASKCVKQKEEVNFKINELLNEE
ncbi:permease [Clostridiaceae bacterium HSG29]|nr:permease [Clostridiaceae bacterium HSG29]